MPKKIKNLFFENLTFEKMIQAHYRARQHKTYKNEVIKFELNLENNITNIINQLKAGTYRLGKYFTFKIYEPKERYIQALPYKDRIVHQWYVEEFIKPYIVPKFISTTYACLTDKGTHKAVDEVQRQMRIFKRNFGDFWILKCDIRKFFYSINANILFNIMKKYISDSHLLYLTQILIFNGPVTETQIGIPIGAMTSQVLAIFYLNDMYHFIKETLKIKYYLRYQDDFLLFHPSKEYLKYCLNELEKFLEKEKLTLNKKTRIYKRK